MRSRIAYCITLVCLAVLCVACGKGASQRLQEAIEKGNLEDTKTLVEKKDLDINAGFGEEGNTPLIYAIQKSKSSIVALLLEKNADVNAPRKDGITPLIVASERKDKLLMTELLAKGADAKAKAQDGYTALHAVLIPGDASQEFLLDLLQLLLAKGADANSASGTGNPLVYLARWRQDYSEVAELLILKGADVNGMGPNGTALMEASAAGSKRTVALLLAHGADANKKDFRDSTPLHEAAKRGHDEIVTMLLDAKASVNAKDDHGETPLTLSVDRRRIETAEILLTRGADPNVKPLRGAPLDEATKLP